MKKIDELKAEIEKAERALEGLKTYLSKKKNELDMLSRITDLKKGDYVECEIKGKRQAALLEHIEFLPNGQWSNIKVNTFGGSHFDVLNFKKWEPKRGEACIFWDYDVNESIVAMFDYSNTRVYYSNQDGFVNCIPFISEQQFKEHIGYEEC